MIVQSDVCLSFCLPASSLFGLCSPTPKGSIGVPRGVPPRILAALPPHCRLGLDHLRIWWPPSLSSAGLARE